MARTGKGNVFITGAAAGIGAAATRRLAGAGYRVFAGVHRDAGALAGIPGVQPVAVDVTDPSSAGNAAKTVAEATGGSGLKAVINNAGVIVQGPLELVPPEELRRQFEVNTFGPAHVISAFLPQLRAGSGRIINVSAPTARVPVPFMAPIGGSKAALESFSDSLRVELGAWGIPVVVIEPGGTDSPRPTPPPGPRSRLLIRPRSRSTMTSSPPSPGQPPGRSSALPTRSPGRSWQRSMRAGRSAATWQGQAPPCSACWRTSRPASGSG